MHASGLAWKLASYHNEALFTMMYTVSHCRTRPPGASVLFWEMYPYNCMHKYGLIRLLEFRNQSKVRSEF